MFYDVTQAVSLCNNDNSLIFKLIKEDEKSVVKRVLDEPHFDYNICDNNGNSLLMCLLKGKYYDEVLSIIDNPKLVIFRIDNWEKKNKIHSSSSAFPSAPVFPSDGCIPGCLFIRIGSTARFFVFFFTVSFQNVVKVPNSCQRRDGLGFFQRADANL